jgi:hypothetical protein
MKNKNFGCATIIAWLFIFGLIIEYPIQVLEILSLCVIVVVSYWANKKKHEYVEYKDVKKETNLKLKIKVAIITISISLHIIFNNFWVSITPIILAITSVLPIVTYLSRKNKARTKIIIEKIKQEQYENIENLLDKIDYMTGQEFENLLIEKLLPLEGYTNINGTAYTGDYGVDIVAEKNDIKCAIQCKRFNNKVSIHAIQEIVAGKKHYRCEKALVITNNYYTKNAKELAFDNKVELLDRDDIISMIKKLKDTNQ